jgi:hypothetical protein
MTLAMDTILTGRPASSLIIPLLLPVGVYDVIGVFSFWMNIHLIR